MCWKGRGGGGGVGLSPWHYSMYASEIVCLCNGSINQSSAVIVRVIVRGVSVGLGALGCVCVCVNMCVCALGRQRNEGRMSARVMQTSMRPH